MREPAHAAAVIAAMTRKVKIPVTVKMRAGWNEDSINAPDLARMVEDAGASAVAVHGRTAAQSYSGHSDWSLIDRVAESVGIPVFGSGDCLEPEDIIARMATGVSGVLVGRGVLRNPWILAQAADLAAGRPAREVTLEDRGQFLLEYMDLLLSEESEPSGFRHRAGEGAAGGLEPRSLAQRSRHERWVINKLRALMSWYSKGLHNGGHLRTEINASGSIAEARDTISRFFAGNQAPACSGIELSR
jgi:tRNA-dihydrouridine synthase